jgi:hypothetical protein
MRVRSIVDLIIERVLNEVALLLSAAAQLDPAIVNPYVIGLKLRKRRQFLHTGHLGLHGSLRAAIDLLLWADIANLTYSEMAVVIGDAVRVGHTAGCLSEQRSARESVRHAPLDLRGQDFASCDLRIEVRYAGLAEMRADFRAMKQTREYRGIGILGQRQRPADMIVGIIQPGDQRPPVENGFGS